jgi:hypothetical protein
MESRWLPGDRTITVNQFITGRCATSLAATVKGQMLGVLTAEVEQTYLDANGPASIIRLVHNEEMRRATEMMLRNWGLTGLIGFDFMLDAAGRAWMIECNPRPTPLGHLGTHVGEDLCAALRCGLTGTTLPLKNGPPPELLVAHFPQEMWRDPNSEYIARTYHDVPIDDPGLLERLKNHRAPKRDVP